MILYALLFFLHYFPSVICFHHPSQFAPAPERGLLSSRTRLPDWSEVKIKGPPKHIRILMAVDAAVSRFYGHDRDKIVSGMLSYMHAVNMYTYQLNLRIQLVDVVAVRGNNLTLDDFLIWRSEAPRLVSHDSAILVRYRYEGGIAYVGGVCTPNSVGIVGFLPESPFEYASVFVHELSHLLGLTHSASAQCYCSNKKECLKIDGFDSDCSAQALVDLLPSLKCLTPPVLPYPRTTISICGNGILEDSEDCDCGPQRFCENLLCEPRSCQFILPKKYLYSAFTFGIACAIFLLFYIIKQICCGRKTKEAGLLEDGVGGLEQIQSVCLEEKLKNPLMKSASTETTLVDIEDLNPKEKRKTKLNKLAFISGYGNFSLDRPIVLPPDIVNDTGYTKMYAPGTQRKKALTPISKLDISEPIPQIVAGKPYKQHMEENAGHVKVPAVPCSTLKPKLIIK